MKRNELAEIKKLDIKTIIERVKKNKKEFLDLVISKNTGKLSNFKAVSAKKKEIAQMLTILKQKQLLEELENKNGK